MVNILLLLVMFIVFLGLAALLLVAVRRFLGWKPRNGLLAALLVIVLAGALFSVIPPIFVRLFEAPGVEVSLNKLSSELGYDVLLPRYMPKGMRLKSSGVVREEGRAVITYESPRGDLMMTQERTRDTGQYGIKQGARMGSGTARKRIRIQSRPAVLETAPNFTGLYVELGNLAVTMESGIPTREVLKVAESLR